MAYAMQTALLTTVNAPYQVTLDAGELAAALQAGEIELGQITSFFTETPVPAQKAFASSFGVSSETLAQTAKKFADWSGQPVILVA